MSIDTTLRATLQSAALIGGLVGGLVVGLTYPAEDETSTARIEQAPVESSTLPTYKTESYVPEPVTMGLLGLGALAMVLRRKVKGTRMYSDSEQ